MKEKYSRVEKFMGYIALLGFSFLLIPVFGLGLAVFIFGAIELNSKVPE